MNHRKTNIELFRILCMFLIIVCHSIIHSGITEFTIGNKFVNFFGYWGGSIGDVGFICITAWYLDKFRFSSKKIGMIILKSFLYSILSLAVTVIFYRPEFIWDYADSWWRYPFSYPNDFWGKPFQYEGFVLDICGN